MTERVDSRTQGLDPAMKSLKETGQWTEQGWLWSRRWSGTIPQGASGINMANLRLDTRDSADSFAHSKVGEFLLSLRPF